MEGQDEAQAKGSDTVTCIERDGRQFWIVGTAHVSASSVEEVKRVIDEVQPDTVCVELCQSRYEALTDASRWRKLDIFKVIREGKTLFLLANVAIGAYQRKLGKELGVTPGAELLAGAEKAREIGAQLELVDRDIHVTLKRTWGTVSFWQKMNLLGAVMESLVFREEISAEDIENLKEAGQLRDMMSEFTRVLPEVAEPLIHERDRYMVSRLREVPGQRIVAVVGAAHVPGMKQVFDDAIDRPALNVLPQPSRWVGALKWIIPAVILMAFAWGWQKGQEHTLEEMIYAWILPNSLVAGFFTAVAGGRPLSVITSLFSSPITSLNPLIGTAMVVGPVEAWARKPTVEDCERINEDVQSLRGLYRNPFTRVLLVAVAASMGSAIGAWIGMSWVLSLLAS